MVNVIIGSARISENGRITGGKVGDQKQKAVPDYSGEVSEQEFYVHRKGWIVLRARNADVAKKLAIAMKTACNNPMIGYDQNNRLDIFNHGVNSIVKTECDCSSLVRLCVQEATGKKVSNFNTATEQSALAKLDMFDRYVYKSGMELYEGDILVTATKGHTAIVTVGNVRGESITYKPYTGTSKSLVDALKSVGEKDTSIGHRALIAKANGIDKYVGNGVQNTKLLALLKKGLLVKA